MPATYKRRKGLNLCTQIRPVLEFNGEELEDDE